MAISIGDALLKLGVDTRDLDKGMKGIGATIKKHQKAIGLGMVAAGGAILAAGALSIKTFAEMGDEVHKMALRTGFATESLSRLKYAAEIGGASLADIEKAAKRMSTSILDAKDGLLETTRSFDKLGIAVEDLEGLSPEEQFMKIAGALAKVEDASDRAAIAQKLFGRAGTALLPMLSEGTEGLKAMMDEAERFGPIFDEQAAAAAAKLTDQMGQLKGATTKVKTVIAEQLIPILIPLIDKIRDAIAGISEWMKAHPGLTRVIVIGTAALGALLIVLGSLLLLMPGLTAALPILGLAFHAALGPIGLITLAITGLIAAGIALWKNWDKVAHFFKDMWSNIKIIFAQAIKYLVKTVLQPLLFYVDKVIGTVIGVLGKIVGFFNKEWGDAIEGVADKLHNLDDEIVSWADNLIESERAVKANRDAQRDMKKTTEEITEAITDQTDAWQRQTKISETLTEATEKQTEAIEEQTDALDEHKKAREEVAETVEDAIEQLQYERSEAGKYRLSINDVIQALSLMGLTNNFIESTLLSLGDKQGNVLKVLEAFNLEAKDVAKTLGMELIPAVDGLADSYGGIKPPTLPGSPEGGPLPGAGGYTEYGKLRALIMSMGKLGEVTAIFTRKAAELGVLGQQVDTMTLMIKIMKEFLSGMGGLPHGGIAMRPITARIAERQPEAVIPLDRLQGMIGGRRVNIFVELDGRTIARVVGQPLVDEIRLRTGVRI